MSGLWRSYLELRHANHHGNACNDEAEANHEKDAALMRIHEDHAVFGANLQQCAEHDEGKRPKDRGARPRLTGQRADFQLHLLSAPQHIGKIVESLGEIAAGFLLHRKADREETKFCNADTLGGGPEGLVERQADAERFDDTTKL